MTARKMRLDDVCNVEYGTRVVQKRDGGSIYPVYGGGGATFKMDSFNRENRLVVSRFGMSEECTRFVSGEFFLNDSGLTVSPKNELLQDRFLSYQLLAKNDEIFGLGKGSAQKNLDVPAFRELSLFVPASVEEQQRIVAILDEAFAGIATAKANAEKNLRNAREIFDTYLQGVFSAHGEAWSTKLFGVIADFRNGINFTKSSKGRQVRVLGVKDFKNNFYAPNEGLDRVTIDGDLDASDSLQRGDIVFVRSNGNPELIGRSLVVEDMSERTAHSGFTIRARLRSDEVLPSYLGHFLKSSAIRRQMVDGGTGANISSLNQGTLSRLSVPYPCHSEQKRIVREIGSVLEETQRLESLYHRKLVALDALKQSLLHQAFSGQL